MSWDTEVIEQVRVIINDLATPPKYSDDRITTTSLVAAKYMNKEIAFTTSYTVTTGVSGDISPDPTELDPPDEDYINLLALKTSILITGGEVRTYALSSMKVMDGPSLIDASQAYKNVKDLNTYLAGLYEKDKMMYNMGVPAYGKASTTPITNTSIYPDIF